MSRFLDNRYENLPDSFQTTTKLTMGTKQKFVGCVLARINGS
jgi:hypothetical protein